MPKKVDQSPAKIYKNLPASEILKTTCITTLKKKFLITASAERQRFTLWRVADIGFEKMGVADSPLDFDSMIDWKM